MVKSALRAPSDDKRWKAVDARMRRMGRDPGALIEVLHAVQESFGYLDLDGLAYVGSALGVPPSKVFGVATFYSFFTLKPAGEHTCVVCIGTACYITGARVVLGGIGAGLGLHPGETTADGNLSLLTARCVGACSLAPVMVVDGKTHGRLTPADALACLSDL
ncbi:MAG: bidirectional [NiFe] hydrogenase diaphorase subunit [Actinomycetota bacterium]|jgi:bidirectional [NiFe] hydrogenase diaphorase subunit|nr:bidirectional [NiFe] hydrogenase diaphorase subunit [Actinomycetota bacterium]